MKVKAHERLCTGKNSYVAFEVENYAYAVSIEYVKGIVTMDEVTPCVIPPQVPEHVKCIIELNGKPLTVVELIKTSKDIYKERNEVIVLNYMDIDIGILAYNIQMINASIPEVMAVGKDEFVYDEEGKIYIVFDISQYDKYIRR